VQPDSVDSQRCRAARRIRTRWGPSSRAAAHNEEAGAWRRWNAGEQRALRLAADNAAALRAVEHQACGVDGRARAVGG
jgi:hypothetical protein